MILENEDQARALIRRSILAKAIYELWGSGKTYDELHDDVRRRTSELWPTYHTSSFKFEVDAYKGKRNLVEQRQIIESFDYLNLAGPIKLRNPSQLFCVFEDWQPPAAQPRQIYLGRWLASSERDVIQRYDLKKRRYISTTSMDAELALITANLALAGPAKIFYDPFVGTAGFPIACAHFGAMTLGSDIDGRSIRGSRGANIVTNFEQYALTGAWLGGFIADLTNSPIRLRRWLDGIVCDPPYGVREGLKVLGRKDPVKGKEPAVVNGQLSHL